MQAKAHFDPGFAPGTTQPLCKSNTQELNSPIRIPLPKSHASRTRFRSAVSAATSKRGNYASSALRREGKVGKLRLVLCRLSLQLLCTSWASTALAYALISGYPKDEAGTTVRSLVLEISAWGLSLYQLVLLVLYWDRCLLHWKLGCKALGAEVCPTLRNSRKYQVLCGLECLFHMVLPYSGTFQQTDSGVMGQNTRFCLSDVLFALVSLRQYHLVRWLYWQSPLPSLRVRFHSALWEIPKRSVFRYKYFLAQYDIKGVGLIYGLTVVGSGLVLYGLEHAETGSLGPLWEGSWVVALTQTTIGYGDVAPSTLPGQLAILVSCAVGISLLGLLNAATSNSFSLTPKENDMYLALSSRAFHLRNPLASAVLLQRWWRLRTCRKQKKPNWNTALQFHLQLGTHRIAHLRSQNLNFMRFERQIGQFQSRFDRNLHLTRSHLTTNVNIDALVSTIQTLKLYFLSKSYLAHSKQLIFRLRQMREDQTSPCSPSVTRVTQSLLALPEGLLSRRRKSSERLAVAKNIAYHNLLIRRSSVSSSGSFSAAESVSIEEAS